MDTTWTVVEDDKDTMAMGVMPYDDALIGSLMIAADEVLPLADALGFSAKEFAESRAVATWEIATSLADDGQAVDFLTVSDGLSARGFSSEIPWLMTTMTVPTAIHAGTYMEKVREAYVRRMMTLFAQRVVQLAGSPTPVDEMVTEVEELLEAVPKAVRAVVSRDRTVSTAHDAVVDLLDEMQENVELRRQGKVVGVRFHIPALDAMIIDDFMPGALVVIYGPEGSGKSLATDSMMQGMAESYIDKHDPSVIMAYITERSRTEVVSRWMGGRLKIPATSVYAASFKDDSETWERVYKAAEDVAFGNVILDHGDVTVSRIRREVRRAKQSGQSVGLVIVDFIQFLTIKEARPGSSNRAEELARIVYGLKSLAREERVVVIAVSSVNYQGLIEGAKAISHSADTIISFAPHGEIMDAKTATLVKNRNGPRGTEVLLNINNGRFEGNTAPELSGVGIDRTMRIDEWIGKGLTDMQDSLINITGVVQSIAGNEIAGVSILGDMGSGKTRLASAIANALLDIAPATCVLHRCSNNLGMDDLKSLKMAGIVILDDIHAFTQPWSLLNMRELLDHRAQAHLPTIITSRLDPGRLLTAWERTGVDRGVAVSMLVRPGFQGVKI